MGQRRQADRWGWLHLGQGATLQVPKGIYAAWVSLPGDDAPVIGPAVLQLNAGRAYQVYAWGNGPAATT